jgi:hypothetical protein
MKHVLIDGDTVNFDASFLAGPITATVTVQPGKLTASGPATLGNKKLCVVGDEKSVKVPGCSYVTNMHPTSGVGTLEIAALAGDQQASKTSTGGVKLMLVGSKFTAKFTVTQPAQLPQPAPKPPQLDTPQQVYMGTGSFQTTNTKLRGS